MTMSGKEGTDADWIQRHSKRVGGALLMERGVRLTGGPWHSSKRETLMPQRELKTCALNLSALRVRRSCKLQSWLPVGLAC